jgi:hypothetical protein
MGRMEVTEEVSPEIVICFHFFSGGSDVVSSIYQAAWNRSSHKIERIDPSLSQTDMHA